MKPEANQLEPYIHRELEPAAARSLALAALDDAELFDELSAIAVAAAALESPATADRALAQAALDDEELFDALVASGLAENALPPQGRSPRWNFVIAGALVAAAAALIAVLVLRPSARVTPEPAQQARTVVAAPAILLTAELRPVQSPAAPVFRSDDGATRAPKTEGKVVSIQDGMATVDLGSIDGIKKGQHIAGIEITTVFRDHARGTLAGQSLQVNDVVRVPPAIHLSAVLEQVNALAASGNLASARDLARNSLAAGSPGESRQLLERLAALDYQAGAADAAREHYEVAVNNFDQPPSASPAERASTLASYSALLLLNGDAPRAADLLEKALAQAAVPALRAEILGNLGAAAQIRGDQTKAADYYRQAAAQSPAPADRAAIQANLSQITKR